MRQHLYEAQRAIDNDNTIPTTGKVSDTMAAVGILLSKLVPIVSDKSLRVWNVVRVYKLAYAAWDFIDTVISIWRKSPPSDL